MKNYENCVRTVNSGNNNDPTSLRARDKLWMSMDVPKPKTKKGDFKNCKNSSLFDISRNMETTKDKGGNVVEGLTGNEKLFYADQRGERRHLLSQGIDTEYEAEQLKIKQAEVESQTSHYCWCKHCFRNISCKGSNCNSWGLQMEIWRYIWARIAKTIRWVEKEKASNCRLPTLC